VEPGEADDRDGRGERAHADDRPRGPVRGPDGVAGKHHGPDAGAHMDEEAADRQEIVEDEPDVPGVEKETGVPAEAYARFPKGGLGTAPDGVLPGAKPPA